MKDIKIYLFNPSKSVRVNRFSQRQCESRCTKKHEVVRVDGQGECPYILNQALAQVLTLNEEGSQFTHMAVCQDGIVPNDWFLDILVEDMLAHDLDMVSGVVPYQNDSGCTTTAIDDPADLLCPVRRLTMHEVHRLPEVFTAKDCGYPDNKLLLSTDCFLVNITKPWYSEEMPDGNFKIRFNDSIGLRRLKDGRIHAVKDDWNFSRDIQAFGAKVAGTRRLVLTNDAERFSWPNQAPWGDWEYDKDTAHKFGSMPISHANSMTPNGFMSSIESRELPDVEGMLSDAEGKLLSSLSGGKRCLDLNPYCGRATIWMSKNAKEIVLLHPGDKCDHMGRYACDMLQHNLRQYNVGSKAVWVNDKEMNPAKLSQYYDRFGVIYVDDIKQFGELNQVFSHLVKLLDDNGLLAFRDPSHTMWFADAEVVACEGNLIAVLPSQEQRNRARGINIISNTDCSKVNSEELKAIGIA